MMGRAKFAFLAIFGVLLAISIIVIMAEAGYASTLAQLVAGVSLEAVILIFLLSFVEHKIAARERVHTQRTLRDAALALLDAYSEFWMRNECSPERVCNTIELIRPQLARLHSQCLHMLPAVATLGTPHVKAWITITACLSKLLEAKDTISTAAAANDFSSSTTSFKSLHIE